MLARCIMPTILGIVFTLTPFQIHSWDDFQNPQSIATDKAVQDQIRKFLGTATREQACLEMHKLRQMVSDDRKLVQQLADFSARGTDVDVGMAAEVIIGRLGISRMTVVKAIVPLLDTQDAPLRNQLYAMLGSIENWCPSGHPDYSVYVSFIDSVRANPPEPLIEHMYQRHPGSALLALSYVYRNDPQVTRLILWAEHVVNDVLWKQRNGFLKSNEVEPAAVEALEKLSNRSEWWVRLYVAEILVQEPEFQTPGMIRRLKVDEHSLVRKVMTRMPSKDDGDRLELERVPVGSEGQKRCNSLVPR